MKTVLVTGGAGYIGSVVARAFKEHDPSICVAVIDYQPNHHTRYGIDFYADCDYASEEGLQLIKFFQPDVVVHCAGTSLVGPSIKEPYTYYHNNVEKTLKLLNHFARYDGKKPIIFFSSSASVYGEPEDIPIDEDHRLSPISPYGNTKLAIENMLYDFYRAYDIPSCAFRYFNAAGAVTGRNPLGQLPGATHIIAQALEASINKKPFIINGFDYDTEDGTCMRDYVHVWDIALAHVEMVKYMMEKPGHYKFNLGSGVGYTNMQIATYIKQRYGLDIKHGPRRDGDPAILIADSHKIQQVIEFDFVQSTLNSVIDSAYDWYKNFLYK